jgi:UDP-N-acetylglucosamine 2-epimerase (non-hydrolysing)
VNPVVVHLIAGARPNFMKVAPLYHALAAETWCRPVLVHTGQHYDPAMSQAFLDDLGLPAPDESLDIGSGTHAEQTARVMIAYEAVCQARRPDWVVVVGDVNSTMACAITATKLHIPVAHLEAGLRSGDRSMPEEINRIVTDAVADVLWTPSVDADENLLREGRPAESIAMVGNIMIDSFEMMRPQIEQEAAWSTLGLVRRSYGVVTLHRPGNVDDPRTLQVLVKQLALAAEKLPLVFPVHPRTRARLESAGLLAQLEQEPAIHVVEPLGYVSFMSLVVAAAVVITDSGGVQEETAYLGIPCLTVRQTTERPVTLTEGSNRLVSPHELADRVAEANNGRSAPEGRRPRYWDGKTAGRVVTDLRRRTHATLGQDRGRGE